MSRLSIFLLLATMALQAGAQVTSSLVLTGEAGQSRTLTMAELSALEQQEVTVTERDSTRVTFRGPTVRGLMELVGAPSGRGLRGPAMLLAVLAEARDGYKVAYMLSELDEQFGKRLAIVALSQDGHGLNDTDGPIRIVVPDEEHRARWIRQLTALRLVRVTRPDGSR